MSAELQRGSYVQTCFGDTVLYGVVLEPGPLVYRVRWESGLTQRLRHGWEDVSPAQNEAAARRALAKAEDAEDAEVQS